MIPEISQGDREIGSRASPDLGVRAAARETARRPLLRRGGLVLTSKEIFFVSVLPQDPAHLDRHKSFEMI